MSTESTINISMKKLQSITLDISVLCAEALTPVLTGKYLKIALDALVADSFQEKLVNIITKTDKIIELLIQTLTTVLMGKYLKISIDALSSDDFKVKLSEIISKNINSPKHESIICYPIERLTGYTSECMWNISSDKLGEGKFGTIYEVCCKSDCKYVAKHIIRKESTTIPEFINEVKNEVNIQREVATIGCALPVYDAWFCHDFSSATLL